MVGRGVWWVVCFFLVCASGAYAQVSSPDSSQVVVPDSLSLAAADSLVAVIGAVADSVLNEKKAGKPKFYPNPKRALRLSLLTPGLAGGQIYNRDYWKLPLVYIGYGTSFYFTFRNFTWYNTMVGHYKTFYFLSDPTNENYGQRNPAVTSVEVYIQSQDRNADLTFDQVKRLKDTYRRWRDWAVFSVAAVYALAAIEANVAAHLKTFDLSDDLSMRIQPSVVQPQMQGLTPGVKMVFVFK